jgi:sarcosine oxidase subunit delta
MLILECPYCGVKAEETELGAGGEAHLKRFGSGSDDDQFHDYLFMRENPKGVHFERCTMTMEVFGTYSAQTYEPPQEIKDKITAKRPGWSWREFSDASE